MRFLWPEMLFLLLFVPAMVGAYLYALRRRKNVALRYASLALVKGAISPGQRFRRHVPPALFLLAMTAAIVGMARPSATVVLPSEFITVVMAMDVSRSMLAADVQPNRFTASQEAAKSFIDELPRGIRLGIVSFAGTAAAVQTPTENKEEMRGAIDRFQLQRGTATGSGIILSLAMLFPDGGIDLESAIFGSPFSRYGSGGAAPIERSRAADKPKKEFTPVPPGSYTAGTIVLLSDGRRTTGPDPLMAAKMAAERGVRVYTVGFGSRDGAAVSGGYEGYSFYAVPDEETLKAVAAATGGEYFHAASANELRKIYDKLSLQFALERKETEVSALFSAGAALLVLGAALLSMLWFHRRS
jgi:Ca-activated chloride channel family protein